MIRVFAWETSLAAEHHFRIGMPFPLLDKTRFDATSGQPGDDIFDYDVVFAHRLAGRSDLWQKLCADPNVLTVYDMDDDLLCVDPENTACYRLFHPLEAETRRNVEAADIVTVTTRTLAERYREYNPNVAVLPVCIPDDMPDWPTEAREGITVGWGGSLHKRQDWAADDVAGKLAEFARIAPDARFEIMGGDYTRGLLGDRLRHIPFISNVEAFYRSLNFSIGIAPLMTSKFNHGKCHTKLIEYGARGIPTVASAIAQNLEWIEQGVNGFLVSDPSEWVPYLLALTDDDTRAAMGAAAREASRLWTISRHIGKWEDVFEGKAS